MIYTPVATVGYFTLGDCVNENIIFSLSKGPAKIAAETVLLLHLISAMPIVINPPSQYFEEIMGIPKSKQRRDYWSRGFRFNGTRAHDCFFISPFNPLSFSWSFRCSLLRRLAP